jgi:hypothetical protein
MLKGNYTFGVRLTVLTACAALASTQLLRAEVLSRGRDSHAIVDTSQDQCYSNTSAIPCPSANLGPTQMYNECRLSGTPVVGDAQ